MLRKATTRKGSSRGTPKVLPERSRKTGRFLSGQGVPKILRAKSQTAAQSDPLRILSARKRNPR